MDLFPTEKEMRQLRRSLNPLAQIMDILYSRPPAEGTMAEFFLESQDIDMIKEDDAMPYFDDIEDDIVNMRRDINGKHAPWYLVDHEKGQLRYKGSSFEVVYEKPDFLNDPIVQHASSWDEI